MNKEKEVSKTEQEYNAIFEGYKQIQPLKVINKDNKEIEIPMEHYFRLQYVAQKESQNFLKCAKQFSEVLIEKINLEEEIENLKKSIK
jgi:hypothetical protein